MTRWISPTPVEIPASFSALGLTPLLAQTLVRRGFTSLEAAEAFLHPESLPPASFPGMEKAAGRVLAAIRDREPICIWGDFDVDGQTATTLLVQALQALGGDVIHYIPVRGREGHGVHIDSLKPILDRGARLILTCDTGITAHEAIEYAASRGADVVVTDHHDLGERLPAATAILNPKLLPLHHPLANLAGVGVAYKLAEALIGDGQAGKNGLLENLLDLVALGLIADVALLKGETRTLARRGIEALRATQRLGLKAMAELSGTDLETLNEETIGFTLAPRLNALGRLGDANPAVELLITQNPSRARLLAAQIEGLNAQRRLLTSQVREAAEAQLQRNPELLTEPVILLTHTDWPGGVLGIVANHLVDHYHKPALLITQSEDGVLRGSARSVEGLHITEAIATQKQLLLGFGGHPMAAGLSLPADKLTDFRRGLGKAIERQLGAAVPEEPVLQIDAWLGLNEINLELASDLESLGPFGAGNPPLTFGTRGVKLKSISELGRAKEHSRLTVEDERGNSQSLLWWNSAGEDLPEAGGKFDIAYSLRATTYRGQRQVTLQFEELRVVEEKPVEVRPRKLEVVDLRSQVRKLEGLNVQVFAEGEDKKKVNGKDRYALLPDKELAIYTTPPGASELAAILGKVKPRKVYIFGVAPKEEKAGEFLTRLSGLVKYALNQRQGRATIHELATATAQREAAIRLGLEWLAAGGHIVVEAEQDELKFRTGGGDVNPYLQAELYTAVKGLLTEAAAYRIHFGRAEVNSLLEFQGAQRGA